MNTPKFRAPLVCLALFAFAALAAYGGSGASAGASVSNLQPLNSASQLLLSGKAVLGLPVPVAHDISGIKRSSLAMNAANAYVTIQGTVLSNDAQ
ncbi:MAG: hypothetical protein M3Z14_07215, partial [Candidatus Eremiobacteraeota bacterium]|nr:hypothetical protein [Candidatus Eremiobacteraeota bacterium]